MYSTNARKCYTHSMALLLFILSFVGIWFGAGLIVNSVDHFARRLRISAFTVSFFVLGILTSIPEFSVGLTALSENKPEVFVGNLIGGIPVIFFLIIPLLAILGHSINLRHSLKSSHLLLSLSVVILPTVAALDGKITMVEGVVMILAYIVLFIVIEIRKGVLDNEENQMLSLKRYSFKDLLIILFGVGLVFISSHTIVENTLYFADILDVSPFYISILFLSLGTNLPELSIALRSVFSGNKDVAFGDYIGSAAANTFLFGIFTLLSGGEVLSVSNFSYTFIILLVGLTFIYYVARTKRRITSRDAYLLLILYAIFLGAEQFI